MKSSGLKNGLDKKISLLAKGVLFDVLFLKSTATFLSKSCII